MNYETERKIIIDPSAQWRKRNLLIAPQIIAGSDGLVMVADPEHFALSGKPTVSLVPETVVFWRQISTPWGPRDIEEPEQMLRIAVGGKTVGRISPGFQMHSVSPTLEELQAAYSPFGIEISPKYIADQRQNDTITGQNPPRIIPAGWYDNWDSVGSSVCFEPLMLPPRLALLEQKGIEVPQEVWRQLAVASGKSEYERVFKRVVK